jgi:2,3-dihydroxybenzoate-AMP ligase
MAIEGFEPYEKQDVDKFTKAGWWLNMTWGDFFNKHTDIYPDKVGLVDDTGRWTNLEFRQEVDRLTISFMDLGIKPKDRVLVQLPNWHEFVFSFLAIQKIGAIVVLLLPRHNQQEINHFCKLTDPVAWVLPEKYKKITYQPLIENVLKENSQIKHVIQARTSGDSQFYTIEELTGKATLTEENLKKLENRRPSPEEVAQVLPTGGTTGLSKLSPRTHNCYFNNVEYHTYRWELNSQDTIMVVTPLGHNLSLHWGMASALFSHAKLVLLDSVKSEDVCEWIQREKVTAIPTVPALVSRMLQMDNLNEYDLSSLKKISVGGAPSTQDMVRTAYEKIDCQIINGFGSVEGTCASTKMGDSIDLICGSVGKAICPYDELKIVDQDGNEVPVGQADELVSRGPGIFTGYFKSSKDRSDVFTKDGFFRTGDQAKKDEFGNIWITGRIKDIIIRGGENISAVEIENLMSNHPKIVDSAVIGMPDEILGERICAYVVERKGETLSFEEIVTFLREKGASVLQLPERLERIDELPMTKVGKLDKKKLRDDINKKLEKEKVI